MSTRNFVTEMQSSGKLDAGFYKCDLYYTNPANQDVLTKELRNRVVAFAASTNGVLESSAESFPTPGIRAFTEVYKFLNIESMLHFAQEVGYIRTSRSIQFRVDYASLQALL